VRFAKYQALGNDYLVVENAAWQGPIDAVRVRLLCDRHRGVGSDGVLLVDATTETPRVRIFNPDGSEAEKSGNGLRIVARYLWDHRRVGTSPFTVETAGGSVTCRVHDGGDVVTIDMGRVAFDSASIPVAGPPREVLREHLDLDGRDVEFSAATVGNPHCVIVCDRISETEARALGSRLETHPLFPNRINVQFVQVLDRHTIHIEIWERGAGYTLASGSSSCAAAAVAHRLGLVEAQVTVQMPGGALAVDIAADWQVRQTGPVAPVFSGAWGGDSGPDRA
jgi:diaminopimelate epimerase